MNTPHLTPWKYFIGPGLFREQSTLYTNLDAALLACSQHDTIDLIPAGHLPWTPKPGRGGEGRPPAPLKYLGCWAWTVLRVSQYADHPNEEPFILYLGELGHPFDAFDLAELRTKRAQERGDKWETYFVCLWAHAENGCRPEIARLPANHLTELRRARARDLARAERRKQRLAA